MQEATKGRRTAPSAVRVPPLWRVLRYRNPEVVAKFRESYDVPRPEARRLFLEVKKWLWLAARHAAERAAGHTGLPVLTVESSMALFDEMWHTFILFTREYTDFCARNFGTYIHHTPTSSAAKRASRAGFRRRPAAASRRHRDHLHALCSYVYDRLGEKTVRTWFGEWAERHTPQYLRQVLIRHRE